MSLDDSNTFAPEVLCSNNFRPQNTSEIDKSLSQLLSQYKVEQEAIQYFTYKKTISNHYQNYLNYFKLIQQEVAKHIASSEKDQKSMSAHKINILKNSQITKESYQSPIINILGYQLGGFVFQYQVIIGKYKLLLDLINFERNAPQNLSKIGEGSYGEIYKINYNKKFVIVAKRTYFLRSTSILFQQGVQSWTLTSNRNEIETVICQLCFNKICSLFQVGPKVQNNFGFDLVCYQDAIEFYIEYCIQPNYYPSNGFQDIKKCVRLMHQLQIIHKDIKPSNLLYSFKYQKYVISDFGLTHFVKQQLGQLTQTYQQGTWYFMCKQMRGIKKGKSAFIDLYYNDMFGLQETFTQLKQSYHEVKQMPKLNQFISIDEIEISKIYQNIHIFFLIKNKKQVELIEIFEKFSSQIVLFQQKELFNIIFQNPEFNEILQNPSLQKYKYIFQLCQTDQNFIKKNHILMIRYLVRCFSITTQLIHGLHLIQQHNPLINKMIQYVAQNYQIKNLSKIRVKASQIEKQIQMIKLMDFYKKMQKKSAGNILQFNVKITGIITKILLLKLKKYYQIQKNQIDTLLSQLKSRLAFSKESNHLLYLIDTIEILKIIRFREMDTNSINKKINIFQLKYAENCLQLYEQLVIIYYNYNKIEQVYKYTKIIYNQYKQIKNLQKIIFHTNKLVQICEIMQKKSQVIYYMNILKYYINQYLLINQRSRDILHEDQVINCLIYLGNIQKKLKNFDVSIQYLKKALKMVQNMNYYKDIESHAQILILVGSSYLDKKMIENAQEYILKALDYCSMLQSLNSINQCYQKLCEINLIKKKREKVYFYYYKLLFRRELQYKKFSSTHQILNHQNQIINTNITQIQTKQYMKILYFHLQIMENKSDDIKYYEEMYRIAIPNFYHNFSILQIQFSLIKRIVTYAQDSNQIQILSKLYDQLTMKSRIQQQCIYFYIQFQVLRFKRKMIEIEQYSIYLVNINEMIKIFPLKNKLYLFQFHKFNSIVMLRQNKLNLAKAYLHQLYKYLISPKDRYQINILTNSLIKEELINHLYSISVKCFEFRQYKTAVYYGNIITQILRPDPEINKLDLLIAQCYIFQKKYRKGIFLLKKYFNMTKLNIDMYYLYLKQIYHKANKKLQFSIIKSYLKIVRKQNYEDVISQQDKICQQLYKNQIKFIGISQLFKCLKYYKKHLKILRQLSPHLQLNIMFILEVIQFIKLKLK